MLAPGALGASLGALGACAVPMRVPAGRMEIPAPPIPGRPRREAKHSDRVFGVFGLACDTDVPHADRRPGCYGSLKTRDSPLKTECAARRQPVQTRYKNRGAAGLLRAGRCHCFFSLSFSFSVSPRASRAAGVFPPLPPKFVARPVPLKASCHARLPEVARRRCPRRPRARPGQRRRRSAPPVPLRSAAGRRRGRLHSPR